MSFGSWVCSSICTGRTHFPLRVKIFSFKDVWFLVYVRSVWQGEKNPAKIDLIFARFFSHCQYASDKYHKPNILLKKYFDSKGEMCPSRTNSTANPWPKTQLLKVLKHCSLIIFVRYIKKIAFHIIISNFPQNDPPYWWGFSPVCTSLWVFKFSARENLFWHSKHGNLLKSSWLYLCCFNVSFVLNDLAQTSHVWLATIRCTFSISIIVFVSNCMSGYI